MVHIECDNETAYRKKNKGFVLPFSTKSREDIDEVRLGSNYKYKKPKNIEKIKEEVKKLREMRERQK